MEQTPDTGATEWLPWRRVILLIVSLAAGIAAFLLVPKPLPELSRQELIAEVQAGYVHEVVVVDKEVITGVSTRRGSFRVNLRRGDDSLIKELSAMGVNVKYETSPIGLI
jgi:hypothetical protein